MSGTNIFQSLFIFLFLLTIVACQPRKTEPITINLSTEYAAYIRSHTSGQISKADNLFIQFNDLVDTEIALENVITIYPNISGNWEWIENHLAQFTPNEELVSNQSYSVEIEINKLFGNVPSQLKKAVFSFSTLPLDFQVEQSSLEFKPGQQEFLSVEITLRSSDVLPNDIVEKMFSLKTSDLDVQTSWNHINSRIHSINISGIPRTESSYNIPFSFDGHILDLDKRISSEIVIPPKGDFRILNIKLDPTASSFVEIVFSDPLISEQKLNGLIDIEGVDNYTYQIINNRLQVFFNKQLEGDKSIRIFPGIRNHQNEKISSTLERIITFELIKPEIRMTAKGTILPSSNSGTIPFETMNLKAVNIKISKIFTSNIPMYFQEHTLDLAENLFRVGDQEIMKSIPLNIDPSEDLNEWQAHHLDLQSLFDLEAGALYQIEMNMHPSYSLWPCNNAESIHQIQPQEEPWMTDPAPSYSYWDNYYPQGYTWQERDNPCHISYYNGERTVKQNILTSDLGLIAKVSNDQSIHVTTTNLLTGHPEINTDLILLDYQLQSIMKTQTDAKGMATFAPQERPYLLIAQKENQKAYLRMDDGQALSISQFNVSGTEVNEGIKVYLYGERGVWRPGDPIHLSCMIDDTENPLPSDYPVSFKLKNPQGAVVDKQLQKLNDRTLLVFHTKTDSKAKTGEWMVEIDMGNQTIRKSIKIETIKPNRLKVDLDLPDQISSKTAQLNTTIDIQWLTGIPGKNLKYEYNLNFWDRELSFPGFEQYHFRDESRSIYFDEIQAFEGRTNDQGTGEVSIKIPELYEAPGKLKLILKGKAFEPSGNFSIDNQVINYSPYSHYSGINIPAKKEGTFLNVDSEINIHTVSLDENGQLTGARKLIYRLYKMHWRWWWDQSGNRANYIRSDINEEVSTGELTTENGKASFSINPGKGGRYYVQICDEESGHCSGQDLYVSWWDGENQEVGANMLTLSAENSSYNVGEDIMINIPGYDNAKALVSIENGSGVLHQEWIELENGQNQYRIQASREMTPNIYFHVSLIQPHNQTINDLPIRLYGIEPIAVFDKDSKLYPQIDIPPEVEPEKAFTVRITEQNDRSMEYTLAIVDEGLLNITNFDTPDPFQYFNAKEALGVKTWDIYDHVIGSYGTRLEKSLSIGGDGSVALEGERQPNRFKPVVAFLGPFSLSENKSNEHEITLPNYIGSVKTMVIAGNKTGDYGHSEMITPVTKPLMVQGTLPRVISPNEVCSLPISIFALEEAIKNVQVNVMAEGSIEMADASEKSIQFAEIGDQILEFKLKAKENVGSGKIIIRAKSGSYEAYEEIEIFNRPPNPEITQVSSELLNMQESKAFNVKEIGIPGTQSTTLEISVIPALHLEKRLEFLISYPHGCVEQTISRAFPQIYLSSMMDLNSAQKSKIHFHTAEAIRKLHKFQNINGGFSYWPTRYIDLWSTSYVGNFLLEARTMGYQVPQDMIDKLITFQSRTARSWIRHKDHNDDLQQTYRLYTLSQAGKPELGLMNRLMEDPNLSSLAHYQLASAFAIAGFTETAEQIIDKVDQSLRLSGYRNTFDSPIRNNSIILESLIHTQNESRAFELMRELAEAVASDRWYSTHALAYTLKAIGKLVDHNTEERGINAEITLPDGKIFNIVSNKSIHQTEIGHEFIGQTVEVQNNQDRKLFVSVISSGVPMAGNEKTDNSGLIISTEYINPDGEVIADIGQLKQGTDLKVITTVQNISPNYIKHIALTHLFPPGWEYTNERLIDEYKSDGKFDYQDIRDDRIHTYFDLNRDEKIVVSHDFTNTYAGRYYLPAIEAEAMYDHDLFARTKGQWIEINP